MTKKHTDYAAEIVTLHNAPCLTATQEKRLHDVIKKWSERVPLVFDVAQQEKEPYTADELGCSIRPMPLMQDTGLKQVGDYACYLPDYEMYTGVLWEKKGISKTGSHDMYNTMLGEVYTKDGKKTKLRDRFIREIEAYLHRQEFDIMIVGVESTEMEYLAHRPNGQTGASIESRHALWKHLEVRFGYRVRVDWLGSRALCCRMLVEENRIWIKVNYKEVLGL